MKTVFKEAIDAILAGKDINISHIQAVTDIFVQAAEEAADAAFDIPEVMHDSLSDLSPKATANILAALMWGLYDSETGNINERGKRFAAQIKHFLNPTHITALQNFIREVGG